MSDETSYQDSTEILANKLSAFAASVRVALCVTGNGDVVPEITRLRERVRELEAERDGAYNERNRLVALLAAIMPSAKTRTNIPGWDPAWDGCIFIELPTGQASWHYHEREAELFDHVTERHVEWDGHSTAQKYERIAACRSDLAGIATRAAPAQETD